MRTKSNKHNDANKQGDPRSRPDTIGMNAWGEYFKGKKVTVMGLGLLGRGVGDVLFLSKYGADITVTDIKAKEQLNDSVKKLEKHKDIKYTLGRHGVADFRNKDFILKAAGISKDNEYIEEARKNGIPIEMDASLFAKLATDIKIVGITGTRGKSTVTAMIQKILKAAGKRVFIGGNIRGMATLPLLEKVKRGDIVVLELDSWQLQGFGGSKISPHIAVFTSFMQDHMNYYKGNMDEYFADKANIFEYQKNNDFFITIRDVKKRIKKEIRSEVSVIDEKEEVYLGVPGEHNKKNTLLALQASRVLGVKENVARKALADFKAVQGRLELVGEIEGVKIYNDNNSTTPDATIAGIDALGEVHLIAGGTDKNLQLEKLADKLSSQLKSVTLLSGSGTDRLKTYLNDGEYEECSTLKECMNSAISKSKKGDIILFSPGFASFNNQYANEYERGDHFLFIVNNY